MRKPPPSFALVHPEALESLPHTAGEPGRMVVLVVQDDHADAPRLPVSHGPEHRTLGIARGHAQDSEDALDVRGRVSHEEES